MEENKQLHEKLKEFVVLRSQLNERDAEIAVLKANHTTPHSLEQTFRQCAHEAC